MFLIVVEGLAGLVWEAKKKNLLQGVKIGRKEIEITLLQFADDTLLFCEPTYQNILTLKSILRNFKMVFDLKINLYKSQIGVIGIEKVVLHQYSRILNYSHLFIPFKYLGMRIGGILRVKFWKHIIDKIENKLSK